MANSTFKKISTPSLNQKIAKEFGKTFFQDMDKQFILILVVSIVIEMILVSFLSSRPIPEYSAKDIARIQERFATFILEEKVVDDVGTGAVSQESPTASISDETDASGDEGDVDDGSGSEDSGSEGDRSGEGDRRPTAEERHESRLASAEVRRRSREAVSRDVSSKGILGLLTGTGSAAEGQGVSSLFSDSGSDSRLSDDLDQVLSSVNGLRTQGTSGGTGSNVGGDVRGSRTGGKATIDDLVSDLDVAQSETFSRKGELNIDAPDEVVGAAKKSQYRSAEAIQSVLLSHNRAIQYCYERELRRNPSLKGKVVVRIKVNFQGHVTHVEIVESTLNSERVERCIVTRIRQWKDFEPIDESEGDVTFRQIYLFGS